MTIKYVFKSFGSRSLDSDNYPTFFVARQGISAPTWFGRNITMGDPREHLRAKLNSDSVVNVINAKMSEIAKDADLENQLKAELIRQLKYSDRKEGEGGHKELARKLVDKLKNRQFKLRTGREFLGGETDEMIKAVFNVVMKKTSPQNQDIILLKKYQHWLFKIWHLSLDQFHLNLKLQQKKGVISFTFILNQMKNVIIF